MRIVFSNYRRLSVSLIAVAWLASALDAAEVAAPDFRNDVIPLLTKLSCNSGGCHGKSTGQGGLKISLFGFHPESDHAALVQEGRSRRILPAAPERSLLLRKATGQIPHGGGRRLTADSEEYRVLYRWIASGGIGPRSESPVLEKLTVSPDREVLAPETQQQLTVTAHFSDGTKRDVTRRAVFESNDAEIADVDANGLIATQSGGGLFAVMVRFGDKIAAFEGTIPYDRASIGGTAPSRPAGELSTIDEQLWRQWERLGIEPSPQATDAELIRRATVDICGTLPTAAEVQAYLADERPNKQALLIDRLLERPEYAGYFAQKWAAILKNRGGGYATSKQRAGTALFSAWIRDSIAENKPYDRFVAEILTATGSQQENPPTIWYRSIRTPQEYVESIAQAFLGVRIQCAQCHHHPAERWSQTDYYGLAAVFARIGRKQGFADSEVPTNEIIFVKREGTVRHPRTNAVIAPRALGGPVFANSRFDDPRRGFTTWMTSANNPFFARTMVNRMWGHFMGRGIIHPIDDARSTNPPSNPELLEALAAGFVESGYDVKQLIRTITASRAYQHSSTPLPGNRGDKQNFARFYPKRLTAEALLDGMSQVLDVPTVFVGTPGKFPLGTRAIDLPDENVPLNFLDVFGRPGRTSACECERSDEPALAQALEIVNSAEIQRKLTADTGYAAQLAASDASHRENVQEIFLRTFARPPRGEELVAAVEFLEATEDRGEAYRTLLWSLLATGEFMFNH